jgi:hypothetical protein
MIIIFSSSYLFHPLSNLNFKIGTKPCSHGSHSEQDYNDNDNTRGPLLTDGYAKGYAMPLPTVTAPVGQTVIYGPLQSGDCDASHTLKSFQENKRRKH